jgi:hypothetical protein
MDEQSRKLKVDAVCARLQEEIYRLGFNADQIKEAPSFHSARFETSKDPYSGEETVCAYWQNARGYRIGELKFHGDGSFYGEYDVALPHPSDPQWFVEGVTAWGRDEIIKSEAKLLAALGD